ncbi:sporulation specific N-acetylmuramoyl-L-alanine amidase [Bacillus sp. SA1-12]|uniref:cell wall hydrolase n=1 Tax=Bacillus sp. SA1-12 TaxID=1455638 RepID=UPI0006272EC6|nr:cell wall hydrolase [Bacillus sp. SA1-12]KKI90861.1 sporulation specific N-acetylmuramoyl-L-alanine amidase [Bacillus sp. SA1-12]
MKKLVFLLTLLASLFLAEPTFAYTAVKGDTMFNIAREHGLSLKELAKANPQVKNLDLIFVGQQINTNKFKRPSVPSRGEVQASKGIFSKAEIDLLARVVRAEAQSEPFKGKVAVANVVLNRVESPKFPDTIEEVIYQPGQFQPVANGEINKPADQASVQAVQAALSNMRHVAQDSLFFYNPDIAENRWLDSRETTVKIGEHVFKN